MGYKPDIESKSEGNSIFLDELKLWVIKLLRWDYISY